MIHWNCSLGPEEEFVNHQGSLYHSSEQFRVFWNGSLIFGGLGGGTCKTSFIEGEAFQNVFKGVIQADNGLRTNSFIQLVAETVYQAGILDQLLKVQKLDNFDIDWAIRAYYNRISQPCRACEEFDEEKICLYTSLLSISLDESLKIVKDYLIATTAKDCSLLISFRPKSDDVSVFYNRVYLDSTNQSRF